MPFESDGPLGGRAKCVAGGVPVTSGDGPVGSVAAGEQTMLTAKSLVDGMSLT